MNHDIGVIRSARQSDCQDARSCERTGAGITNRCFAWDDENQLVSVWVTNQWRSDFAYDGKMRRRIRREYSWTSGSWILNSEFRYIYDGNLAIQERDGSNLPQVTYTRGPDLSGTMEGAGGIGGLLARVDHLLFVIGDSRSSAYYHADGNGNITCLINSSNAVVAKYEYDPYGNILSKSGPLAEANLYRFSSKELHANSGLVYYLHRFYDPNLQRWPNRDPLGDLGNMNFIAFKNQRLSKPMIAAVEMMEGPNIYAFVHNSPITGFDPFGLKFGNVLGSGKLCTGKDCKKDKCKVKNLPEKDWGGKKDPWEDIGDPGKCKDSDAACIPGGHTVKIPDNCKCTIDCSSDGRYKELNCSCWGSPPLPDISLDPPDMPKCPQ